MIKARNADSLVMYVATAPSLFTTVQEQIAARGPERPATRVVLENPWDMTFVIEPRHQRGAATRAAGRPGVSH